MSEEWSDLEEEWTGVGGDTTFSFRLEESIFQVTSFLGAARATSHVPTGTGLPTMLYPPCRGGAAKGVNCRLQLFGVGQFLQVERCGERRLQFRVCVETVREFQGRRDTAAEGGYGFSGKKKEFLLFHCGSPWCYVLNTCYSAVPTQIR